MRIQLTNERVYSKFKLAFVYKPVKLPPTPHHTQFQPINYLSVPNLSKLESDI